MASVTRATIPEEFYDWTSASLLVQPEPQYVYAEFLLRALGISLSLPGSVGMAGRQISGTGPSYETSDQLTIEPDVISDGLVAAKVDFNGQPGNVVRVNRPKYTDSVYQEADRRIPVGTTISTTGIKILSEQVSLVLDRFGGPHDGTKVAPYVLERFDSKMGLHDAVSRVSKHMKRDFHKTLDTFVRDLLNAGSSTLYPKGMTAADDATAKGQYPLDYETLSRVAKTMDEASLPTLGDGRRVFVATPTGMKQLKDDPQFARYAHDFESKNPLFNSYRELKYVLPEWYIFASNTLSKTPNTSSIAIHQAHAIAPGVLGVGMGEPPRVANNTNDNYGESVPLVWLAYLALSNLDNRMVVEVKYTEDVS